MVSFNEFTHGRLLRFITSHWLFFGFFISLAVRLATISLEPFWYDEAFTSYVASLRFGDMLQAIAGDTHPPIWYAMSWLIAQVAGASPLMLRLPAALFSALCVGELYKLCKRYAGPNQALIASGLLAVLPAQIYYGQEARMYSLLTLLVLIVANAIASRSWLRVALGGVLMMYTHNMAILYAVPLGIWSIISSRGQVLRYWYIALAYVPWLGVLKQQVVSMQTNGFWIVNNTPGSMLYFLEYTTFFNRLPAWALYHGSVVAIAMSVMSLWALRRELLTKTGILALLGLAPTAELYVISQVWRPMMLDRLLLPAGTMIVAIWAAGFTRMTRLSQRIALTLFVPVFVLSVISYYRIGTKTDYGVALQPIFDNWQDGDTVYHNSLSSVVLFRGKLPDDGYILPGLGDLAQSLSEPTKIAMGIKQRELTPEQLVDLGYHRLWVLHLSTPMTSQHELDGIQAIIDRYPIITHYDVGRDQFVTFEVVLLRIEHETLWTDKPYMLPLPASRAWRPVH